MAKNTTNQTSPAQTQTDPAQTAPSPAKKGAEKGSRQNPYHLGKDILRPDWEKNKSLYAGKYFMTSGGKKATESGVPFRFTQTGETGQPGNIWGSAHSDGTGIVVNKGGALRLKKFFTGDISPVRFTDETEENFKARVVQVNLGATAIKAIAGNLQVKTAKREAGKVTRLKTEAELDAETLTMDRKEAIAYMLNPANLRITEDIQESEGKTVSLSELTGDEVLESGQESGIIDLIMQSVRAALRATA